MTQSIKKITPRQAKEWVASGEAVLIDVREPEEFRGEHIASALSLPLSEVGNLNSVLAVPAGRKIIFQCLKGGRGAQACERLASGESSGHEVFNLEGGITGWKADGLPVVGGGARRHDGTRPDDYDKLAAALDKVDAIASAHGLKAHYHPHLSTIVENPDEVRAVFARTPIGFCPDTAHLAAAGADVATMVREHADRISYIHLKGLSRDPFAFVPVGRGDLDNGAVIQALKDIGYQGWVYNELDAWPDPAAGAAESLAFVRAAMA